MSRRGDQMVLQAALAYSAANKAKTTTEKGTVIVQERYDAIGHARLHVWHISEGAVAWTDFSSADLDKLSLYGIKDPYGAIWLSVGRQVVTQPMSELEQCSDALSPALLRVLCEVAGGYSNTEIAQHLDLSLHTVRLHIYTIMKKLGIHNRVHLVIYALKAGLISLDEVEMPERTKDQQEQQ
ncbi:hypothetical protein KSF_095540 [Reticulibacter mediterranei]|uniref:HTH luxR-type domain-containing protein n=1 Tax=Reticulibacter mediterranei TaxID=2778369 RepID=A0A8J3IRL7_9CHLR|nr:LuxR C-terminal-related transcriptional regulator [Reticulibacter mediterranei]GHO99506.1 hypothetical protein KSF_095540 [Reticulibacter mediterranei]